MRQLNILLVCCVTFTLIIDVNTSILTLAKEERMIIRTIEEIKKEARFLKSIKKTPLHKLILRRIGRKIRKFRRQFRIDKQTEKKISKFYDKFKKQLTRLKEKIKNRYTKQGLRIPRRIVRPPNIINRRSTSQQQLTTTKATKKHTHKGGNKSDRPFLPLSTPLSTALPIFFSAPPIVPIFRQV